MAPQPPGDDDDERRLATLTETEPIGPLGAPAGVAVGMTLGRYRLRERVGQGGMGVVFAAHDPELDRTVAVKILHPELGGPGSAGEQRLRREGQTMARLTHPNVLRVYDVGVERGVIFVAMEYVAGGTLKDWLAAAPSHDEILDAFAQAGRGLAAAHDAGLVHRDFKPSNVLVSHDGRVLVTDFGVARASADAPAGPSGDAGGSALVRTVTRGGGVVGTPAYMAPEQHQGRPVDGRADQFSFCVALWRALYGTAPYAGESWSELAESTASGRLVEPPSPARVAPHVRAALTRGLQPDPAARFDSMGALLDALADDPARRRRRRLRLAWGMAAVVLGLGALALVAHRLGADPCAPLGDRFAGVWDADTRAAVHQAFKATGVPFAESSFREVARQLDARRAAWEAMRRQSCEATRVRKEQSDSMLDARAACLERSFGDVAAFVGVLLHADAGVVRGAAKQAAAIGDVAPCGDVATLGRRAPLPNDPRQRQAIAAVEHDLGPVRARVEAGHLRDSEAEANRLVERARATGYAPLLAEALTLVAELQQRLKEPAATKKVLDEAVLAAEAGGDDALRFKDEVHLFTVIGYLLERDADAQPHAAIAEALLKRLGPNLRREATLANARAVESWWNGHYAEARSYAERAVALQERIDPKGAELAYSLHVLGIVQQELHQNEEALKTLTRARTLAEAALGAQHPLMSTIYETLGGSLRHLRRYDEAQQALLRGLAIAKASYGEGSADYAGALQNLGTLYLDEGKIDEGIGYLRRAVDVYARALGPEHSRVADVLVILGDAYRKAKRPAEAEATLLRAIAIHRARFGPDNPVTASSIKRLADFYLLDHPEKALKQYQEALRAMEASQGKTSPLLAPELAGIGDSWQLLHQPVPERAAYERALKVIGNDKSQEKLRLSLVRELAKIPKR